MQKEDVIKIYDKKHLKKAAIIFACVFATAVVIVCSIYLNPSKFYWFDVQLKRIAGMLLQPAVLSFCLKISFLTALIELVYSYWKDIRSVDNVLLKDCDMEAYPELIEFGATYGESITARGLNRFLLKEFQSRRNSPERPMKRSKIHIAADLLAEEKYDDALRFLANHMSENNREEVLRRFYLAEAYLKKEMPEDAKWHLSYVIKYGNTLPEKALAETLYNDNYSEEIKFENIELGETAVAKKKVIITVVAAVLALVFLFMPPLM